MAVTLTMPEGFDKLPLTVARIIASAVYQHHLQYGEGDYKNLGVIPWGDTPHGFQFWKRWAEVLTYSPDNTGYTLELSGDFDPNNLNKIIGLQKEVV